MPKHVHLLVATRGQTSQESRLLARTKPPPLRQIKELLIRSGSSLAEKLTVREKPGMFCFRFWQEGPGFDRNLYSAPAIEASINYLHENPVKRGLCQRAVAWKWASARVHQNNVTDSDLPKLVHPAPGWFDHSEVQTEHSEQGTGKASGTQLPDGQC